MLRRALGWVIASGLIVGLLGVGSLAQAKGFRPEAAIRKDPKDVAEYFLLLPFDVVPIPPRTDPFEARKAQLTPSADRKVTLELPQGYLRIEDNSDDPARTLEALLLTRQDGSRVLALAQSTRGGECPTHALGFYEYRAEKWKTVSLLPEIRFAEFWTEAKPMPKVRWQKMELAFELVPKGSGIKARPVPVCAVDGEFADANEFAAYTAALEARPIPELLLRFDRKSGTLKR